jgi:hypothetical protein
MNWKVFVGGVIFVIILFVIMFNFGWFMHGD